MANGTGWNPTRIYLYTTLEGPWPQIFYETAFRWGSRALSVSRSRPLAIVQSGPSHEMLNILGVKH